MLNPTDTTQANNSNTSTLRPLGIGEILDITFSLYRKHFRLFLGIAALHFSGNLVVYLLGRFLPNFPLKNWVTDLVDMPFGLISMGGIIVATATIYLGKHIRSRDALQQAGHRFWQMLASHLPWSLVFVIPRTVVIFPLVYYALYTEIIESISVVFVFARLTSVPFSIDLPMNWEVITYGLISLVTRSGQRWIIFIPAVLAPFALYFAVRWMFASAVVLLEKPLIRRAFERSSELTRGRWWHVGGMLVSFAVLSFAIQRIVVGMIGFIFMLTKAMGETTSMDILKWMIMYGTDSSNPLFYVIMWWINLIVGTLIFPIWIIGITLLYFDLRIRKEGFDIEMQVNNPDAMSI
ncbi:MAG: hypothetical protein OXH00_14000 [Candidatus Poribacteria bacterium]|nr:hypothetical protein [Candidatus Poribacteria bacterium]